MPFGFPPERAFSFTGIPTKLETMAWCCPEFARHVDAASGTGLGIVYVYVAILGKMVRTPSGG
jgi:hypothetical protein